MQESNTSWLRLSIRAVLIATLVIVAAVVYCWYKITHFPLPISSSGYSIFIAPGTSLKKFTKQLQHDHLIKYSEILRWYAVYKDYAGSIKAGEYVISPGATADQLLAIVVQGKVVQHAFTIIEGWRFANVLTALHSNPKIVNTLDGLNEQQIIEKLQIPITHLEGMFLPDTYYIVSGTTDVAFLRRAYSAMQMKLDYEWQNRAADTVLQSPYEALILASIIEKESGIYSEYPEISGVFQRRIALGMRLQADPCVIYGLGSTFTGTLFKNNLQQDSPYNTYRRNGLPPTPIAIPSKHALHAALHPAEGDSMYFVAGKDGAHIFSKDLQAHNSAVKNR